MVMGNKGKAVAAIKVAKFKTASLMLGIILTLFYNIPFELINLRVSDFMLVLAAILSVISGVKYYMMARVYFLLINKICLTQIFFMILYVCF